MSEETVKEQVVSPAEQAPSGLTAAELRKLHKPVKDILPCGLPILRKSTVSIEDLIFSGALPAPLLAVFMRAKEGDGEEKIKADALGALEEMQNKGEAAELLGMFDAVFKAALIHPQVVDSPTAEDDNDHIWISDAFLTLDDKTYIFEKVTGGVSKLNSFRGGQKEPSAA